MDYQNQLEKILLAVPKITDEGIYDFFVNHYFSNQPNARKHLIWYRNGKGMEYNEDVTALLFANPNVKSRLAGLIYDQISTSERPITQGVLFGKGIKIDGRVPPIRQSDYNSEDWKNSNGNVDEVQWRLNGEYNQGSMRSSYFQITIIDPYEWHPEEFRITKKIHQAFVRLKGLGAMDYISRGTARVSLPAIIPWIDTPIPFS